MHVWRSCFITPWLILFAGTAFGQFGRGEQPADENPAGQQLEQQLVQRYQVGVIIRAGAMPCAGLTGSAPVPMDWPEQQVRIVDEEISPDVRRVSYRQQDGLRQMVFSIPQLPPGNTAEVMVTFEVTRRSVAPPSNPAAFVFPKRVPADLRVYLASSPGIDCRQSSIRNKAKELVEGQEHVWKQVETIYDWVRDNVAYRNGTFKGATATLKDGSGNKEDLVSLFVALCRANEIPARTVWVVDHVHAEFYLMASNGRGYWLPCQVAGTREFGGISDHRPILQKGDNFKVPGKPPQRFVPEDLTGKGGSPHVEFVRKMLAAN